MAVSLLVSIVLLSNPIQNKDIITLGIGLLYILLFYFFSKKSLGQLVILRSDTEDDKSNKKKDLGVSFSKKLSILGVFVMLMLIFGKGQSMYGLGYISPSNGVGINEDGSIVFDTKGFGNYDVGIEDEDNNGRYETVKYDVNFDGSVDIMNIDKDGDGEIDSSLYFDYQSEAYILLVLSLVYLVISYFILRGRFDPSLSNKFGSIIIVLALFASYLPGKYILAQQPDLQKMISVYPSCAENPFNADNCKGVDSDSLIFFKHMQNPKFMDEYFRFAMKAQTARSQSEVEKVGREFLAWWNGWKNKTPINQNPPKEEKIDPKKKEPKQEEPEQEGFKEEEEVADRDPKTEEIPSEVVIDKLESTDLDDESPKGFGDLLKDEHEKQDSDHMTAEQFVNEVSKVEKTFTDISKYGLETLNEFTQTNIQDYVKLDQIDLGRIDDLTDLKNSFMGDIGKYEGLDEIITDLNREIDFIKKENLDMYGNFTEATNQTNKLNNTIKALDIIGKSADFYMDGSGYYKKFNGDLTKTGIATTVTTGGKWILGANPVDAVGGAISGVLTLAGEDKWATKVSEFSAGDIVKKTVENSYDTEEVEFGRMLEWEMDKMSKNWDAEDTNIATKSLQHLESTVNIFYGGGVYGLKKTLDATEGAVGLFNEGVKEIWSWF